MPAASHRYVYISVLIVLVLSCPARAQDCTRNTGRNASVIIPIEFQLVRGNDPLEKQGIVQIVGPDGTCVATFTLAARKNEGKAAPLWGTASPKIGESGGLAPGESFSFRVKLPGEQKWRPADPTYSQNPHSTPSSTYEHDRLYVVNSLELGKNSGVETPLSESDLPDEFRLNPNYPNPFNPQTRIPFELPARADVRLTVYNVLGQKVLTRSYEDMDPGQHSIRLNLLGQSSGLYLYRVRVRMADERTATASGRMTLSR